LANNRTIYGFGAADKIAALAAAVAAGDHRKIVSLVDESDAAGRDDVQLRATRHHAVGGDAE